MNDRLKDRFRALDSLEFPFEDQTFDRQRAPTRPVAAPPISPLRRAGIALVALLLAAAGFVFVV
jgi:hypothetical protein